MTAVGFPSLIHDRFLVGRIPVKRSLGRSIQRYAEAEVPVSLYKSDGGGNDSTAKLKFFFKEHGLAYNFHAARLRKSEIQVSSRNIKTSGVKEDSRAAKAQDCSVSNSLTALAASVSRQA